PRDTGVQGATLAAVGTQFAGRDPEAAGPALVPGTAGHPGDLHGDRGEHRNQDLADGDRLLGVARRHEFLLRLRLTARVVSVRSPPPQLHGGTVLPVRRIT